MIPDELLVAGCGRSGTTWLAELLNYDDTYRFIFEPLRPDIGVALGRRLGYWRYLRPDHRDPELLTDLDDLLSGRARNAWADRFNFDRAGNDRRLVKAVRAHFLLGWMQAVRPDLRVFFLIRHPCAVVASELRMGWTGWQEPVEAILAQPDLMADHLEPFRDLLTTTTSLFDQRVVLWCVRTLVPLRQLAGTRARVVFYESLAAYPDEELPGLFAHAGRDYDPDAARRAWSRRSSMTVAAAGAAPTRDPLNAWRESVEPENIARAAAILDRFGLGGLYDADGRPDPGWTPESPRPPSTPGGAA